MAYVATRNKPLNKPFIPAKHMYMDSTTAFLAICFWYRSQSILTVLLQIRLRPEAGY